MAVRVKICGLTALEDARAALDAGADLLGFIFYAQSPRYISPEQVCAILAGLAERRESFLAVGVFVNEQPAMIAQLLQTCGLDAAQLHGEEPPEALAAPPLSGRAYKALRPRSPGEANRLAGRFALPETGQQGGRLPALLIDAYHPSLRGGAGQRGDWKTAARLAARFPLLLAGGLNARNVSPAIRLVRPWGVDVASGVESEPGRKDYAALRAFVAAAKNSEGMSL